MALLSSSERKCDQYHVRLDGEQRRRLLELTRNASSPAQKITHARILLKADADGPDARTDGRIAEALDACRMTVMRVRQRFAAEGLGGTLRKKKAADRQYRSLDGAREARSVAIACSDPPEGHARWTLSLLARELTRLEVVSSICPETVRRALKKTNSSPG